MSENEEIKSKRELILERLKEKHPEADLTNEEELFALIYDNYDNYDKVINGFEAQDKSFAELFGKDPRSAAFFMDWKNGEDPVVGLVRKFGLEIKDIIDDPEMQEKLAKANQEYLDRVTEAKDLEEKYEANLAESMAIVDKMQKETGYSDEQIDQAIGWLMQVYRDIVVGKFSPEIIEMAIKAQNYEEAVAQAEAEGEVRGRNTKIEEKLRTRKAGDGTVMLDGRNGGGKTVTPTPDLGAIDRYNSGMMNIWERGGERRRRNK